MFQRIECNPLVLGGKPCIRGTRISVELVLEWLGSGASRDQIVKQYPQLTADDIQEATRYAVATFQNDVVVSAMVAS